MRSLHILVSTALLLATARPLFAQEGASSISSVRKISSASPFPASQRSPTGRG